MYLTLEKIINIPIDGIFKSVKKIRKKQESIIKDIGYIQTKTDQEEYQIKTNKFKFDHNKQITDNQSYTINKESLEIPLVSLVRLPNINLENVEIEYDVEIMGCKEKNIFCINQPLPNSKFPSNLNFKVTLESY